MTPEILFEREGAIATVTLSNPDKLNALTVAMWCALKRVMAEASENESVRCVVLRGAGDKAFAAGADIAEFAQVRRNASEARAYHRDHVFGALQAIAACRHPTVAMIHGACVGGGLEIACQCDLRIAGASARFGVPINKLGFPIAYDELAALLPLAGRAVVLEILVEGRVWSAAEAHEKGLLTRVVSDAKVEAEALACAERIAEGAPLAARWHKRLVRRVTATRYALDPAEIDENFAYFGTEDYRIGFDAFMRKRKPKFLGR
ncbi:MAG: enoyl-CoA hydratase/isomerase family protein [Burkholderiales bacterium]